MRQKMNGLLLLSADDFRIGRGENGDPLMFHNTQGFSMVLFYSVNCGYCGDFINSFKELPGMIQDCQFGIVNVGREPELVNMSKHTKTELKFVPYILFFVNGCPINRYTGPPSKDEIRKFVLSVGQSITRKNPASNRRQRTVPGSGRMPAQESARDNGNTYFGVPYKDEDVCYLNFNDAYTEGK